MLPQGALLTEGVSSVNGRESSPRQVKNAQDVQHLLERLLPRPKLLLLVREQFNNRDFGAWIWGEVSFALVEVHTSILHGRIADLLWAESEAGFNTKKDVLHMIEKWAKEKGASKILTLVYQHIHQPKVWERLWGWKTQALAIGKEL